MRKIAIIGAGTTRYDVPAEGWEKWSLNNLYRGNPEKCDRWFELHDFKYENKRYHRRGNQYYNGRCVTSYLLDLHDLGIPVYMQKKWPIIERSIKFPFKQIIKTFNSTYFGCSFAWMIAFALYEHLQEKKIDTLGFWGVDLIGAEYYKQRPSTEYWTGRAQGMGIKIEIAKYSELLNIGSMYAIEENYEWIENNYVKLKDVLNRFALYMQQTEGYDLRN